MLPLTPPSPEKLVVLGVLQNEWFKDPERIRQALAHSSNPKTFRRRLITYALFAGCRTGRILKKFLGEDWCEEIIWENASPQFGGISSCTFPADKKHLYNLMQEVRPNVVIAFGMTACGAFAQTNFGGLYRVFEAPHPCARDPEKVARELTRVRRELDTMKHVQEVSARLSR